MIRLVHPEHLIQNSESPPADVAGRELPTSGAVESLQFSSDGLLLSSSQDSVELVVWDTNSGEPRHRLKHTYPVASFAIHPRQTYVISSDIHSLKTWSLDDGSLIHEEATWSAFYRGAMALSISPDGGRVAVANESDLCSWGTSLGISRLRHPCDTSIRGPLEILLPFWFQPFVKSLTFSKDGGYLAAGGDWYPSAWIWNLNQTNRASRQIQLPQTERSPADSRWDRDSTSVEFHPTRPIFAVTNGHVVELRDADTLRTCGCFVGHRSEVNSLKFDPSGNWLLTGSDDGTAKIWNVNACRSERTYDWGIGDIRTVAVCPKSGLCAAGASSSTLILWNDPALTNA